jgi:hypothetical protein
MKMKSCIFLVVLYALKLSFFLPNVVSSFCGSDNGYSMYVWTQGFNASAPFCDGIYPESKSGSYRSCWFHNWESAVARQHLWASTKIPGREVTRIFLSDVLSRIVYVEPDTPDECDADLVSFLAEAHERGIKVYALFAASDESFGEQYMAKLVPKFNTICGNTMSYFDGVSVNNEYFSQVRDCTKENQSAQIKFLNDLNQTVYNSKPLPVHFSVSWNWDCCDCSELSYVPRNLTWNGETTTALAHMIEIADSIDVQVAYNVPSVMTRRARPPHQYWLDKMNKTSSSALYVLAYTNPNSLCQLSFSPHKEGSTTVIDTCHVGNRTEAGMFAAFDYVEDDLPGIIGGIHYMSGVFSTGMTEGWPKHNSIENTCPLHQRYHKNKNKCVNICKKGKVWSQNKCKCKCPKNCKRMTKGGRCKPQCNNDIRKWDPIGKTCIPISSETEGFIWDKASKKCLLVE